ncbi:MAG: EutN/CcmL family microcompartment protein [Anaerolineae bacterium]|jgi:microcompartment protein CcmK/EutM|nr:EutN/CcmL family microcompartment protein [Anaerolineae bacterium]
MLIARVVGSAVSTIKADKLSGSKLLVVQEANAKNQLLDREPFVAVDTVGAGRGELVLIVTGSAARYTCRTEEVSVDAAIVGILDSLELDGEFVFKKEL